MADISIDNSALTAAVQTSIEESTVHLSYEAVTSAIGIGISSAIDVALGKIEQAVSNLYSKVGTAISHAFSAGFHTSTEVVLTANYKLANPTANISFSGGGTGSAMVKASLHAEGGYFDQPHLGIVAEAGGEQGNSIYFSAENKIFKNSSGSRAALNINLFLLIRPFCACETRFKAVFLSILRLSGELSFLALDASSRKITSRHQCSWFSIDQCFLTLSANS